MLFLESLRDNGHSMYIEKCMFFSDHKSTVYTIGAIVERKTEFLIIFADWVHSGLVHLYHL